MKRNCLSYTLKLDGCKVALQIHDMPEIWRSADGLVTRVILRRDGWALMSQNYPAIMGKSVFLRGDKRVNDDTIAYHVFDSQEDALAAFNTIGKMLRDARLLEARGGDCYQQRAESC